MNDVEKSIIRIRHSIDHNKDHMDGYNQVVEVLKKAGCMNAVEKLEIGISHVKLANEAFASALSHLPESGVDVHSHDHENHDHSHMRPHSHSHDHSHTHDHDHSHVHENQSKKSDG